MAVDGPDLLASWDAGETVRRVSGAADRTVLITADGAVVLLDRATGEVERHTRRGRPQRAVASAVARLKEPPEVAMVGPWLAAWEPLRSRHESTIVASGDGGRTWTARKLPGCGNAGCELAILADGAIDFMSGSEAACGGGGQWRQLGHLDGREAESGPWPIDSPLTWFPSGGWAFGACEQPAGSPAAWQVCAFDREERELRFLGAPASDRVERAWVAPDGRRVVVGGGVFDIPTRRDRSARLVAALPEQGRVLRLTPRGALLVVAADGRVLRLRGRTWVERARLHSADAPVVVLSDGSLVTLRSGRLSRHRRGVWRASRRP